MPRLTSEHKRLIVERLACFTAPSDVRDELRAGHEVIADLSQITRYDPTTANGAKLAKPLKRLFESVRHAYLHDLAAVPIASRAYRMNEIQRLYDRAKSMGKGGNIPLALALLVEAEKFMGELYTNRRKVELDPKEALARLLGISPDDLPDPGAIDGPSLR